MPKKMTPGEIEARLPELPGWTTDGKILRKKYQAGSFTEAMERVNAVAGVAEQQDHHPDFHVHYREVTFELWTHVAGGVTSKDFDLAREIERIWSG